VITDEPYNVQTYIKFSGWTARRILRTEEGKKRIFPTFPSKKDAINTCSSGAKPFVCLLQGREVDPGRTGDIFSFWPSYGPQPGGGSVEEV